MHLTQCIYKCIYTTYVPPTACYVKLRNLLIFNITDKLQRRIRVEKENIKEMCEMVTEVINNYSVYSVSFEDDMREIVKEMTWNKVIWISSRF